MALIDVSSIIQLAYFGSFIVLMFYGQRIQVSMLLVGVKRNLGKLERLRKAAHDSVLSSALRFKGDQKAVRSEEHTSELQSRRDLVCRLLLEKKKNKVEKHRSQIASI